MAAANDLASFVRQHFRSVWTLEVLLALRRDTRTWTADELVQELRASKSLVTSALGSLERSGLAAEDEASGFRFAPASPVLAELCSALADAYRERPVALINLIAAPDDRIQQLADAFRLGGRR